MLGSVEVSIDLSFSSCGQEELRIVAIVTEFLRVGGDLLISI